ncbi:MAG: hypothetical protein M3Q99_00025 [Acidobacteriota bacterium]|nr:hypothetical protein [Acidobacteriota bacterium]
MISIQKHFRSMFVVFLIVFSATSLFSQQKPKVKVNPTDDEKQKRQFIIEQAIFSLKDVLRGAKSIDDVGQRAYIVAEASKILWKYDESFAQDSLLAATNNFISDYESIIESLNKPDDAKQKIGNLNRAIGILLRAVAKNDLKSADKLQEKFFKLKDTQISGENNLNEKLKMAQEGEGFDIEQSVNLVGKIIEFGIPVSFPQYLFDLKKKNPALADNLYRQALFNLSAKPFYKSRDAVYLSIYAFNEPILILPLLQENKTDDFFIFTTPVNLSAKDFERKSVVGFISAYQNFLNSRLQNQSGGNFNTPDGLLQAYFLNKKLKAYNRLYNLRIQDISDGFEASLTLLAENAGLSRKLIDDLTNYAERTASNNNPLGLGDGTEDFEKAEKSNDPKEKLHYTIEGILRLIDRRKFAEAESKLLTVSVSEIKDSLNLLINTRAGLLMIEQNEWEEFEKRIYRISDKQIKAFLYVKALYALDSQKQRKDLFADYLLQADKNLDAVDDKKFKAKGFLTLSALVLPDDKTKGQLLFIDALKALNSVSDFREDSFEINIKIPGRTAHHAEYLYKNGFEKSFMLLAKIDWLNSQIQVNQVKSPELQAIAQIAASKSVLQ